MPRETRAVLASAYKKNHPLSFLTHEVVVSDAGRIERVLCGRAKIESIADPCASDVNAAPTCPRCKDLKRQGR